MIKTYTELNNGLKMPLLGFGTYKTGDRETCAQTVCDALCTGYRMIDTASFYANEEGVGLGIKMAEEKAGIERKDIFLITKIWFDSYEGDAPVKSFEKSLEKLGTDYVDALLLHWPYGNYYNAWRKAEEIYKEGKAKCIGVSNFTPDRLVDLSLYNKTVPAINQIETHILCQRKIEHEWCEKFGAAHQAYAPLGHGKTNDVFENEILVSIAEKYGKTPAQICLNYLMSAGISVIPKASGRERMKENFESANFEISEEDKILLAGLDRKTELIGNVSDPLKTEKMIRKNL